ncbi:MAG TPA: pyridoxamine 5'-phosphate oxidase [Chloroflexota bacterium]|jgi:PPOX class probable F420-dependent enzyme|nr:pyridoxamine 5'-phosphate oxidase [Chloroflexota bacterium]
MIAAERVDALRKLARQERGFAIVSTTRADGSIQSSLVNAGVMDHPSIGEPVVAYVARGRTAKLAHLRKRPQSAVVFRAGGSWLSVEGVSELAGPDDPASWLQPEALPQLLRDVFTAAGGTHDNWPEYDRVMATDRRCAVFVKIERLYGVVR